MQVLFKKPLRKALQDTAAVVKTNLYKLKVSSLRNCSENKGSRIKRGHF